MTLHNTVLCCSPRAQAFIKAGVPGSGTGPADIYIYSLSSLRPCVTQSPSQRRAMLFCAAPHQGRIYDLSPFLRLVGIPLHDSVPLPSPWSFLIQRPLGPSNLPPKHLTTSGDWLREPKKPTDESVSRSIGTSKALHMLHC